MSGDLYFLTIAEAVHLIRSREISPVELTRALLDRIAAIDPQVNAYIPVAADLALEQARAAEREIARGDYRGPLHGIPVALKDAAIDILSRLGAQLEPVRTRRASFARMTGTTIGA